jgi:hypothetical protein
MALFLLPACGEKVPKADEGGWSGSTSRAVASPRAFTLHRGATLSSPRKRGEGRRLNLAHARFGRRWGHYGWLGRMADLPGFEAPQRLFAGYEAIY